MLFALPLEITTNLGSMKFMEFKRKLKAGKLMENYTFKQSKKTQKNFLNNLLMPLLLTEKNITMS